MDAYTQYELYDLFISLQGEAQTTSGLFLTVVSGYLVVAYLVGKSLTRLQVMIVTGIFMVFTTAQIGGHFTTMLYLTELAQNIDAMSGGSLPARVWPLLFLFINASIAVASLKFMWDVRHPKS